MLPKKGSYSGLQLRRPPIMVQAGLPALFVSGSGSNTDGGPMPLQRFPRIMRLAENY